MLTVAIENESVGVTLELELVREHRAFIKESVGSATLVVALSGLSTILEAGCVAVGGVFGELVTE